MSMLKIENYICDFENRRFDRIDGANDALADLANSYLSAGAEINITETDEDCDCYTLQIGSMSLKVSYSKLIGFEDLDLESVGKSFLHYSAYLANFHAPELKTVGDYFLTHGNSMTHFSVPKLKSVGDSFLTLNTSLVHFSAPELERAGDYFLTYCISLIDPYLPKLREVGKYSGIQKMAKKAGFWVEFN